MQITIRQIPLLLLLLTCFSFLKAQDITHSTTQSLDISFEPCLSGELFTPAERFSNSQYYFDNWMTGNVTLISGDIVKNQKIQYNAYMDEVFWLHPAIYRHVMLDKLLLSGFTVINDDSGNIIEFKRIKTVNETGREQDIFARLLYENSISLYSRRVFRESGSIKTTRLDNRLVSRISLMSDHKYFLVLEDATVIPVSRNRRSLYNAFPGKRIEIRSTLRRNRNRIRNEADLIEAVGLINNIIYPVKK